MAQIRKHNRAKTQTLASCDMNSLLEAEDTSKGSLWTASKVIATIGPSCHDVNTLCAMLEAGMTCVRIDLTWGPINYHKATLRNVAEAAQKTRKLCAVMVDTLGREIMVKRSAKIGSNGWPVHDVSTHVTCGQTVTLTTEEVGDSLERTFQVSYKNLPEMCDVGDMIYLARYLATGSEESSLYMQVTRITETDVVCTSQNDATLSGLLTVFHTERSASSLTNLQNELPVLHDSDKDSIKELAREFAIDFISLSFTRGGNDVKSTRKFLNAIGLKTTKIMAKLETRQSLFSFKSIATEADGIIMSRGNLGLDVVPEKMALIQKAMVANCNIMGKPTVITRLVDTMTGNPRPTRAEATDVANAVIDGADAFLLGASTLRGMNPVLTVSTVLAICRQAEQSFDHIQHFDHLMSEATHASVESVPSSSSLASDMPLASPGSSMHGANNLRTSGGSANFGNQAFASLANFQKGALQSDGDIYNKSHHALPFLSKQEAIASSAVRAADKVRASLIIVYTASGHTASLVAKYRPPMPILTLVIPQLKSNGLSWSLTGRSTARQCLVERGLLPMLAAPSPTGDTLLEEAVAMTTRWGLVQGGDHIVCIEQVRDSFVIKIVSVDSNKGGISDIRPQSLDDLVQATSQSGVPPVQLRDSMSRLASGQLPPLMPTGILSNTSAVGAAIAEEVHN